MEKNANNFSADRIQALAHSDEGKRLMEMLGRDRAADVRRSAQQGNMSEASKALSDFLSDPKVRALLKQLEEKANG